MAFIAIKRLRFGDGRIEPGEPVPVEQGRNYASMLRHGMIARVDEGKAPKKARGDAGDGDANDQDGGQDPAVETVDELAKHKRADLDALATELGIENPDQFGNRKEIAEAIVAKRTDSGDANDDNSENDNSDAEGGDAGDGDANDSEDE